ncbi:hypothetical protein GJ496_000480, partial [Pomphorhynchus laevis]
MYYSHYYLSYNAPITSPLSREINLLTRDLSNNILSLVHISKVINLELRLTHNPNDFELECNTQLTDLRFNKLQSGQIRQKIIKTAMLLLDYNLLVDLNFLSAKHYLRTLKYLSCSHNLIRTINEEFFESAINLERLDLSYNYIKNIPNRFLHSKHAISYLNLSFNLIAAVNTGDLYNMIGLQDVRLFGNPITDIPSDFLSLSSTLKSIAMTLKHRQCFNASRISSQIEEIKFSGCQINMKDYFGLDNLTYIELESTVLTDFDLLYGTTGASTISILSSNIASMDFLYRVKAPSLTHLSLSGNIIEELNFAIFKSIPNVQYLNLSFNRIVVIAKAQLPNTYNLKSLDLRGNRIQLISDFIYLFNKSTDYLNMIQNNNQTEGRFADYLEYSILPIFDVQIDYNLSLPVSNLIYHSALPKVLCLHSTCIPGKHIELVARSQGIGNPYGVTCPAMYSKYNEFKN